MGRARKVEISVFDWAVGNIWHRRTRSPYSSRRRVWRHEWGAPSRLIREGGDENEKSGFKSFRSAGFLSARIRTSQVQSAVEHQFCDGQNPAIEPPRRGLVGTGNIIHAVNVSEANPAPVRSELHRSDREKSPLAQTLTVARRKKKRSEAKVFRAFFYQLAIKRQRRSSCRRLSWRGPSLRGGPLCQ